MNIQLDYRSGVPIYKQLIDQIKFQVSKGILKRGERLPTVRQLAEDISINFNTVSKSYHELELQGVIEGQRGNGTFLSATSPPVSQKEKSRKLDEIYKKAVIESACYGIDENELINYFERRKKHV